MKFLGIYCFCLVVYYVKYLRLQALKQLPREKIQLATKFGIVCENNDFKAASFNGKPEYVRACCEASLKRLDVDYIDLYYQHRIDPSVPIEETVSPLFLGLLCL